MPYYDGVDHSPDEALAAKRCPECGKDFNLVNPIACLNDHWRVMPRADRDGEEGLRRMAMLKKYIEDNRIETTKPAGR